MSVVFPAHAGMDRVGGRRPSLPPGVPRTRGDGPGDAVAYKLLHLRVPRTRGDGPLAAQVGGVDHNVFPAHAGMDLGPIQLDADDQRVPRTRGDGPNGAFRSCLETQCSPHTRGWTGSATRPPAGIPRVPRTRGDGPSTAGTPTRQPSCSPHTRGWTEGERRRSHDHHVFPAHAGMDRWQSAAGRRTRRCSPHTRGWTEARAHVGFRAAVFPAHAGMDRQSRPHSAAPSSVPRTRGDGPVRSKPVSLSISCSPHTRGWTDRRGLDQREFDVFPAHAGMDRSATASASTARSVPRTRGDGPAKHVAEGHLPPCSPHTRGWTGCRQDPRQGRRVFPAHAGMDRGATMRRRHRRRVPRTRGDGPESARIHAVSAHVFPAHAGMDRR